MKYFVLTASLVVLMVVVTVMASPDHPQPRGEVGELSELLSAEQQSLQPHKRSKRTIGHIFDMFRKMMGGLFGGGGGKGKGRPRQPRPGSGYGAPQQQQSSGYGAPQQQQSSGYGAPQQQQSSGYGAPQQQQSGYGAPRPPRPPPPPRQPSNLSGGYAGGQPPPPQPPSAPVNNYGGPPQNAPQTNNQDSYGSPQAAPQGNSAGDSYGSPQAAPVGQYGGQQQGQRAPAPQQYGQQQGQRAPAPQQYGQQQGQRAPAPQQGQYGGQGQQAPRRPALSQEFGPASVFYDIPAPNLATEAPQGAPNNYAGASQQQQQQLTPNSAPDSYGSPQAATLNSAPDSYGSPQAPTLNSAPDSYGSPQAPTLNSAPDSYGSPQAPTLNSAPDGYGSPQAPTLNSAPDGYGSPQAPTVNSAPNSYGSPQAPTVNSAPNSYGSPQGAPQVAPSNNYGAAQGSNPAPARNNYGAPQGNNPAPNNYGAPQGSNSAPNNYGGSVSNNPFIQSVRQPDFNAAPLPVVNSVQQSVPDLSGNFVPSPQLNAASDYGAPTSAPNSYGSPQGAPQVAPSNNYGAAQGSNPAPARNNYGAPQGNNPAPNNYGAPQGSNSAPNNYGGSVSNNPFIQSVRQPDFNAAPLPVVNSVQQSVPDLSGNFVPSPQLNAASDYGAPTSAPNSYGSPQGGPISDIDLPQNTPIIIEGRGQSAAVNNNLDIYGSPVAPVGTSAPVPDNILSAERQPDSFDSYGGPAPEGELTSTRVEADSDSAASPLFEDLRNVAFTSADETPTATEEGPVRKPITIDLTGGIVDLTNGFDSQSGEFEIDLTTGTTSVPELNYDDEYEYAYVGDENVPPAGLDIDLRSNEPQPGYGGENEEQQNSLAEAGKGNQDTYGKDDTDGDYNYEGEYDGEYEYEDKGVYEYESEYEDGNLAEGQEVTEAPTTAAAPRILDQSFISVPLMIEEIGRDEDVEADETPVILAGTEAGYQQPQPQYGQTEPSIDIRQAKKASGGLSGKNTKRRAPHAFHQFLVEAPQAKRQASDWSSRVRERRRNRVWRQFNLD
jgi:hypothetical protein